MFSLFLTILVPLLVESVKFQSVDNFGEDAGAAPVAEVEATADDGAATGGAKGAAAVEVVELSSDEDERRLRENTP